MLICVYVWMCLYIYVYVYICLFMQVYMCVYIYVSIYIYMYNCIYTYICIYIYMCFFFFFLTLKYVFFPFLHPVPRLIRRSCHGRVPPSIVLRRLGIIPILCASFGVRHKTVRAMRRCMAPATVAF